jgi:hypothetical protein
LESRKVSQKELRLDWGLLTGLHSEYPMGLLRDSVSPRAWQKASQKESLTGMELHSEYQMASRKGLQKDLA